MGEGEFFKQLSAFLAEKLGEQLTVERDTDLLATGSIDSLTMVEVLTLIEQWSGQPVEPEMLEPELFENAGRLYRTFFRQDVAVGED